MSAAAPLQVETVTDVCDRWSISRAQLYKLMNEGLPSRKLGRSRRFIASEVDAWLLERTAS